MIKKHDMILTSPKLKGINYTRVAFFICVLMHSLEIKTVN
jgi:hypothetical protein